VPTPPIKLQNKFADFVEKVEKQKALLQDSLKHLETNYKSLMQQFFE
jgi:type I restriction enzyme S subunit